jgi:ECF sigma factor
MMAKTPQGLTVILSRARAKASGERARGELIALIHDELRRVASRLMLRERTGHTLPPTAVVH